MKHYKFWLPIILSFIMQLVAVVYITAVFKTTVEQHIADENLHLTPFQKIVIKDLAKKTTINGK